MLPILTMIFFVFGLIIGSFLNVVILRYNTNKTFGGRSACMTCRTTLSWYELIPLGSYVALGGRCKNCKVKISIQYPLVELATGFLFAVLFLKLQNVFLTDPNLFIATFAYYALLFSLLIIIATYDIKHKIIPDIFSGIFGVIALIGIFIFPAASLALHLPSLWALLSGPIVALPFVLLWFLSGGTWMGLGDGKLALGLGWMLGLSVAISGIVVSFWTGAIVGIILMIFSKNYKMKSEIPFGPFLVFGTIVAFLFELHIFSSF
jgi:leader peptidase (prepilin peptidase)/N-methyltransferase